MEQNNSFINQPLPPSVVAIMQSPNKKYSYYRISHLLDNSTKKRQKQLPIQGYRQFSNQEKARSKKKTYKIKSQLYERNDYLPTIKKKSQRLINIGSRRSSQLLSNSAVSYKYPLRKQIFNPRSISMQSETRPNQQTKSYLKKINNNQCQYQNQGYLQLKHPISAFNEKIKKVPSSNPLRNDSKSSQNKLIKLLHMKTEHIKERNTLSSIYFSFRRQNILKGKLQKRIPKLPNKLELQDFVAGYIPNNPQIDIKSLLKTNFCVIEYFEKSVYIGEMIAKHKNGIGILVTQKSCFEGEFKNNQKVKGIEITMSGVYKGSYLSNQRFGKGEFQRHTGQLYIGDWMKGKKHGAGLWINTQGQSYQGQWRSGKANGQGVLNLKQRSYNGYFLDFKQQGFGREYFKNGDSFEGIFRKDLPHGQGTYRWRNGSRYSGRFENGMRHGIGQMYIKDMIIFRVNFTYDRPDNQSEILFYNPKKNIGKIVRNQKSDLLMPPIL